MHKSFVHTKAVGDLAKYIRAALNGLRLEILSRGQLKVTCLPYDRVQLRFGKG